MPISKAVGQPLQVRVNNALDYYPYGKVLREYRYGDESRYMTTQHERDQETGLDYRGARYYDSELGRFNSVDPWAKKYASWSTYNYVMGNPVMLVDPTGRGPENNIRISKNGNVEVEKTKDNFDMIYIEGDKEPIKLDKGQLQYTWEYKKDHEGKDVHYEVLQFSSNTLAERIFERIANQSMVEWSFVATKRGSSQAGFLTNSGLSRTEGASSYLYFKKLYHENYKILADIHSHPRNTPYPSGNGVNFEGWDEPDGTWGDRGHAKDINDYYERVGKFQFITYKIYLPKTRSYIEYDEKGIVSF